MNAAVNATSNAVKTRYVGFCAFCERDMKLMLPSGKADVQENYVLVHHGFERPGYGHIVGDCAGVHEAPYETSCKPLHPRLRVFKEQRRVSREYLARLEAGVVAHMSEIDERASKREGRVVEKQWAVGVTALYAWEYKLRWRISDTKNDIDRLDCEIARLESLIINWVKKPVRTLEEEVEKERRATAARRAVTDQKRAAREAVLKAKADKKAKLLEKHQAEKAAIDDEAVLADLQTGVANRGMAERAAFDKAVDKLRRRLRALDQKRWFDFAGSWKENGEPCKERDALVTLGLAQKTVNWRGETHYSVRY